LIVFEYFAQLFEYFRTFYTSLQTLSNVSTLPIPPKPRKLTHQTPFLPQKPTSPRKITSKNPDSPPIFQFCILLIRISPTEGGFDRDPAVLGGFRILLSLLCILRSKKVFAKSSRPCIIGFMVETRAIRSSHKAVLGLGTLLLRRKAQ